mmetsp:Transcript_7576/g.9902  ORF Transcript_7576/g.9902 Transcript_7576/m.9902 type:complete len:316 (-) Transcript_7576:157-1104(-)|eukprot:CAMPEP_0198150872 /NCGR_PEP_ID=MMETSP1443-20131203/52928_1 /TAXON_ID=186043 /ORGANISM="Entomoneis sp., Strain CCMP2396" /LENGTH=315 /DNA_ID=CAMNT_0043816331 /DNA_START=141 /DNA_END=1088 /DNA_ORIENTATION=+
MQMFSNNRAVTPDKDNTAMYGCNDFKTSASSSSMAEDPAQMLQRTAMNMYERFMCCTAPNLSGVCYEESVNHNFNNSWDGDNSIAAEKTSQAANDYNSRNLVPVVGGGGRGGGDHRQQQQEQQILMSVVSTSPQQQRQQQQEHQSGFIFLDDGGGSRRERQHEQQVFTALTRNRSAMTATTASVSSGTSSSVLSQHLYPPIPGIQSSQTFDESDDDDGGASANTRTHSNVGSLYSGSSSLSGRGGQHLNVVVGDMDMDSRPVIPPLSTLRAAKQRAREHREANQRLLQQNGANNNSRRHRQEIQSELSQLEGYRC